MWMALCGSIVLWPVVHVVFTRLRSVVEDYQKRAQDVRDWLADEEVDGLLEIDRYIEDFKAEKEKGKKEEKRGEKTNVEGTVSAPPPYVQVKTEKSSIS